MTTNPIIPGYHPDPSVCRVGEDFYLVNSTFEYLPGVPVCYSRDLVNWTQVGNVLSTPEHLCLPSATGSGGIFAPTIRHHDGLFFMITTSINHIAQGHLICHAERAEGPWSTPVFVEGTQGIDPDLFWDVDGSCWLSWTGGAIKQVKVDPMTGERLSEPRLLWPGTGLANPEGPHLYRRGEYYYLLLAEGGTERGHAVTIARATSLEGPWEPCPHNPILSHRSTTEVVQNTGHSDLVELADGSWALVFLGVRPVGPTPMFHLIGRETFVAGIDWVDDWPVVDEGRFDVPGQVALWTDTFETLELDERWIAPGRHPSVFATVGEKGLAIEPTDDPAHQSLVCVRVEHFDWQANAALDRGRLTLRLDQDHWASVELADGQLAARLHIGPLEQVLGRAECPSGARLAIRASLPGGEFPTAADIVRLGHLVADDFTELASFDGRYLSTEVAGLFTGRVVGVEPLPGQDGPTTLTRFAYTGR